jgi:hypothetical protein
VVGKLGQIKSFERGFDKSYGGERKGKTIDVMTI